MKGFKVIFIISSLLCTAKCLKDEDEGRPYEFGFTIDGQQHRHEKKDANGIIQGEFGFITADGVYHVTTYATDENGSFRILSMRNVKISGPLDGSGDALPQTKPLLAEIQNPNKGPGATPPKQTVPGPSTASPATNTATAKTPYAFTTLSTLQTGCAGCGVAPTTAPTKFQFQNPVFKQPSDVLGGAVVRPVVDNMPNLNRPNDGGVLANAGPSSDSANVPPRGQVNIPLPPRELLPPGTNPKPGVFGNYDAIRPGVTAPDGTGNQNPNQNQPPNPTVPHDQNVEKNSLGGNFGTGKPESLIQNHQPNPTVNQAPHHQNVDKNSPGENLGTGKPESLNQNQRPNPTVDQAPHRQNADENSPGGSTGIEEPNLNHNDQIPNHDAGVAGPPKDQRGNRDPAKPTTVDDIKVMDGYIYTPNNPPIEIKDKYPGMVDGLPDGINQGDISDLLYKFNYTIGFHGHYEKGLKNGTKIGGYFVNGRDGYSRVVTYVADELGYRPKFKLIHLGLDSIDTPKEGTEKTFGLKNFEFVWYPLK